MHEDRAAATRATVARLAADQHGVVARSQLLGAGVSRHWIDHRFRTGALRPIHRGVYRVGPLAADLEPEAAALLACGADAVVSHRSAAYLWAILDRSTDGPTDITIRRNSRLHRSGIRIRRNARLESSDVTTFSGLRITVPRRTLLDLATVTGRRELEQAVAGAFRLERTTPRELSDYVTLHVGRPGASALRRLLDAGEAPAFTRSEAEERFLSLVRRGGLPPPAVNSRVEGYEVDFAWRKARLLVEVDGFRHHSARGAFERDRTRDAALTAAGFRVVRVTWRQLTRAPEALLVRLAQALARG